MNELVRMWIVSIPKEYDLVVIEEEKIPLVESITRDYEKWLAVTGQLIVFFLALAIFLLYVTACEWRRKRVKELEKQYGQAGYSGWNLVRLGREISRLEMEAVEHENFLKNSEPNLLVKES